MTTRSLSLHDQYYNLAKDISECLADFLKTIEPITPSGLDQAEMWRRAETGELAVIKQRKPYFVDHRVSQQIRQVATPLMGSNGGWDDFLNSADILEICKTLQWITYGKDQVDHPVSKFLYIADKPGHLDNQMIYFSADHYGMCMNDDKTWPRWTGHRTNGNHYKSKLEADNREANNVKLRIIYNGPAGKHLPIRCALDGRNIEAWTPEGLPDEPPQRMIDLHHARHMNGQSLHKSNTEPSDILTRCKITQEGLLELCRCVAMSPTNHMWVHRSQPQGGDLTFWQQHWAKGLGAPSFVLQSERNFLEVCMALNIRDITWKEFIGSLFHTNTLEKVA